MELLIYYHFFHRTTKENISDSLASINKGMSKLAEIRKKMANGAECEPSQKQAVRTWLGGLHQDYPYALTLTIKPSVTEHTERGVYQRQIKRDDCDKIALRFQQKLNREVFGRRAADSYGHTLKYIAVVEGERSCKALHLHLAVGGLPAHIKPMQLQSLVSNARLQVRELNEQFEVNIADSGWLEYITKELGRRDTDNVLWQLA